jgi:hypothetical protein
MAAHELLVELPAYVVDSEIAAILAESASD